MPRRLAMQGKGPIICSPRGAISTFAKVLCLIVVSFTTLQDFVAKRLSCGTVSSVLVFQELFVVELQRFVLK